MKQLLVFIFCLFCFLSLDAKSFWNRNEELQEEEICSCVFCDIIERKEPATIIYETEKVIVIKSKRQLYKHHYLVIPKKHIVNILDMTDKDLFYAAEMVRAAREVACQNGCCDFNLNSNNGAAAGQTVFHMHWHFYGR